MMTFKTLILAGATLAMISGAAIAQTSNSTTQNGMASGSPNPGQILEDQEKMKPFYTDAEMKMMRTGDEFNTAFKGMSSEDQDRVRNECQNTNSPRAEFCESIKNIQ